jgi:hypothetical protein
MPMEDLMEIMSVDSSIEMETSFDAESSTFSGLVSCWTSSPDVTRKQNDDESTFNESLNASNDVSFAAESTTYSGVVSWVVHLS